MNLDGIVEDIISFFEGDKELVPNDYTKYNDDARTITEICMRLNYIKHRYEMGVKAGIEEEKLDKFVLRALEIWPGFMYTRDLQ